MAGRDIASNLGCEEIRDWFTKTRKGSDTGREARRGKEELEKEKEWELRDKMEVYIFLMQAWFQIQEHCWVVPGESSLKYKGKIMRLCLTIQAAPVNTDDQSSESKAAPREISL